MFLYILRRLAVDFGDLGVLLDDEQGMLGLRAFQESKQITVSSR